MAGANAVQYAVTPFWTNSSGLSYQLQESQDLENWTDLGSSQSGVNYPKLFPTETNVTTPYVRLKASVFAAGKMVLAITINTSHQSP